MLKKETQDKLKTIMRVAKIEEKKEEMINERKTSLSTEQLRVILKPKKNKIKTTKTL